MTHSLLPNWAPGDLTSVPFEIFTNPAVYDREQTAIFQGPFWSYVGLEAELPTHGDFIRSDVGEKPVIVVRDAGDEIRVLANRCAHRGVTLCHRDAGNARELVCPYHQWTYDLQGRLTGVPFKRGYRGQGGMAADFDIEQHGLQPLRVARRGGVIFACFDQDVEPFEDYLGPRTLQYFDRVFTGRPLAVLGRSRQRIPCNWKLMVENIKDPYHGSLLHVFLVSFGLYRLDQKSKVEMDATGRHATLSSQRGEQTLNDATQQMRSFKAGFKLADTRLLDPVKEFAGDETVAVQTIFPNLIIQQQSNTLAMRQIVPRGPEAMDLVWTFFGYADDSEEMRLRRLRQANWMGPSGFVSVDDSEILTLSQRGIAAYPQSSAIYKMGGAHIRDEQHMVTEAAVRGFYRYYREVMGL
jgi:salicylate 5-hydroxylase large subunit